MNLQKKNSKLNYYRARKVSWRSESYLPRVLVYAHPKHPATFKAENVTYAPPHVRWCELSESSALRGNYPLSLISCFAYAYQISSVASPSYALLSSITRPRFFFRHFPSQQAEALKIHYFACFSTHNNITTDNTKKRNASTVKHRSACFQHRLSQSNITANLTNRE